MSTAPHEYCHKEIQAVLIEGQSHGPYRFTIQGKPEVYCSRECRDPQSASIINKANFAAKMKQRIKQAVAARSHKNMAVGH